VVGLPRSSLPSTSRAMFVTPFHSVRPFFNIISVPSFQICQGLSLDIFLCNVACQDILWSLSQPQFLQLAQTITAVLILFLWRKLFLILFPSFDSWSSLLYFCPPFLLNVSFQ
jgi:hypothetical protein